MTDQHPTPDAMFAHVYQIGAAHGAQAAGSQVLASEFPDVAGDRRMWMLAADEASLRQQRQIALAQAAIAAGQRPLLKSDLDLCREACAEIRRSFLARPEPVQQRQSATRDRGSSEGRSLREAPSNSNRPPSAGTDLHTIPAELDRDDDSEMDGTERHLRDQRKGIVERLMAERRKGF